MTIIDSALALATVAHWGQKDHGGNPYILHPLRVMSRLRTRDEELMAIAVLHDAVEDSNGVVTLDTLAQHGLPVRVIKGVELLTHDSKVDYMTYVRILGANSDARRVKLEDLRDNSDITRLKGLRQKDFERMNRYQIAFDYLINWGAN